MEEDIEILKNFIEKDFSNPMGWSGYYDSELKELQQAIKNKLKAYKEDEAVIEEIKKEVRDHIGFANRLKRESREPDLFNQGRFYVANNIKNILAKK